jgi:hypothetical protein
VQVEFIVDGLNMPDNFQVGGVAAMAEIEAKHIHPCLHEFKQFFVGIAGWADSGNDFGALRAVFTHGGYVFFEQGSDFFERHCAFFTLSVELTIRGRDKSRALVLNAPIGKWKVLQIKRQT